MRLSSPHGKRVSVGAGLRNSRGTHAHETRTTNDCVRVTSASGCVGRGMLYGWAVNNQRTHRQTHTEPHNPEQLVRARYSLTHKAHTHTLRSCRVTPTTRHGERKPHVGRIQLQLAVLDARAHTRICCRDAHPHSAA